MDNGIILAAPREREVADPMVPTAEFEVEDAGETTAGEAEVPGCEVAMNDNAGPARELKSRDPLAGALQVPSENMGLFRAGRFLSGQHGIERRVGQDCLASPPSWPLSKLPDLYQVGVELRQEPPTGALLAGRVVRRGWVTGKEWGEAPDMPGQFHRPCDNGRDGPPQRRQTRDQTHFVVD